jgi:DNA-directed RNA polymerase subunit alpha
VNYRVEKTRVGQSTDFDRLVLEIWTDGTIGAVEALGQSADILIEQFMLFGAMGRPEIPMRASGAMGTSPASLLLPHDRYNTPIEELNLSVRAYNCLKRSGLMTVGQVLEKSEEELLALRNFGRKSYDELRDRLIEFGYIDPDAEGLQPIIDTGRGGPRGGAAALGRPARPVPGRSSVILDEEDEEESLGALGKALKEALKEVGDDDLLGADDED